MGVRKEEEGATALGCVFVARIILSESYEKTN